MKTSTQLNSTQLNSTRVLRVFLALFVLVCFASCVQKAATEVDGAQFLTTKQAMVVALDYVYLLPDSTYELRLTPEKATELGIDPKDYEKMQQDINQSNEFIKKTLEEGIDVDLVDPQSSKSKAKRSGIIQGQSMGFSRSAPGAGGLTITTAGQGEGRGGFNTAYNTDPNLAVNCWATGIMQYFKVWAMTCGTTSSAAGIGEFGAWSCSLFMICTNTTCAVGFQTANSNGGYGTFSYRII